MTEYIRWAIIEHWNEIKGPFPNTITEGCAAAIDESPSFTYYATEEEARKVFSTLKSDLGHVFYNANHPYVPFTEYELAKEIWVKDEEDEDDEGDWEDTHWSEYSPLPEIIHLEGDYYRHTKDSFRPWVQVSEFNRTAEEFMALVKEAGYEVTSEPEVESYGAWRVYADDTLIEETEKGITYDT